MRVDHIGDASVYLGDCHALLPELQADAIITDPPYHLTTGKNGGSGAASLNTASPAGRSRIGTGFMGMAWDGGDLAHRAEFWAGVLGVVKPGGHLLAFGGTRTFHRLACAIEDAGWEIRDTVMWVYGSGFPKSLDVSKAIDREAGAERPVIGSWTPTGTARLNGSSGYTVDAAAQRYGVSELRETLPLTGPATDAAKQWQGWGTALKPAWEPIIVARKPLEGTVAENVQAHGTGALNIDGCRIGQTVETWPATRSYAPGQMQPGGIGNTVATGTVPPGRWPANLIHDGSEEVVALFPADAGAFAPVRGTEPSVPAKNTYGTYARGGGAFHADTGSAARFFYTAKASKWDRDEGNTHPTVKPTELMRYLCRLVTPPGGVILDPFMGSGSTGCAAALEGFKFIGIEIEPKYFDIACQRITAASAQLRLFA